MPPVTEEQKAGLAKERGERAAYLAKQGHFKTPEEQQKFISAQGDAEAKGKLDSDKVQQLHDQGVMSSSNQYSSAPYSLARKA